MIVRHFLYKSGIVWVSCILNVIIVVIDHVSNHYMSPKTGHISALFSSIFHVNICVNVYICNTVKSNQLMMLIIPFSMGLQTVGQGDLAFGSIHAILFVILITSMTLSILAFWCLIFWIYLT